MAGNDQGLMSPTLEELVEQRAQELERQLKLEAATSERPANEVEAFAKVFAQLSVFAHWLPASVASDALALLWQSRPKNIIAVKEVRWRQVRYLLDYTDVPYTEVFDHASNDFAGTDGAGEPGTFRKAYETWERSLPPEQQRRKTHRPKKPSQRCVICEARRLMVRYLLNYTDVPPPPDILDLASEKLKGLHAAGTPEAIRRSYEGLGCATCRPGGVSV